MPEPVSYRRRRDFMKLRQFAGIGAGALLAALAGGCAARDESMPAPPSATTFDLEEATIAHLQRRMETGQDTSRTLVDKYLARIEAIDRNGPALHSVIEINP